MQDFLSIERPDAIAIVTGLDLLLGLGCRLRALKETGQIFLLGKDLQGVRS